MRIQWNGGSTKLLDIRGSNTMSPLLVAALYAHKDMVLYLYSMANNMIGEEWSDSDRIMVMQACVATNLYANLSLGSTSNMVNNRKDQVFYIHL